MMILSDKSLEKRRFPYPSCIDDFYKNDYKNPAKGELKMVNLNRFSIELTLPLKEPSLLCIDKLLEEKQFNQIYSSLKGMISSIDYLCQLIPDHCESGETKKDVSTALSFLHMALDIKPIDLINRILDQPDIGLYNLRPMAL